MSDHTPVLFNVFEDWNEESGVPHISFLIRFVFDSNASGRFSGVPTRNSRLSYGKKPRVSILPGLESVPGRDSSKIRLNFVRRLSI